MVPGMTERERLAADARRLEWLAEATIGPSRVVSNIPRPLAAIGPRPALPLGLWRRGLSAARILGCRLHLAPPRTTKLRPSVAE